MQNNKVAKEIINNSLYLSLATCVDDESWIAPLWYAMDEKLTFYFISEHASIHALHIKKNPKVAFSIFNSQEKPENVNGLQIKAQAYEVGLVEIPHALSTIFKKSGADLFKLRFKDWSNPQTYFNLSKFRVYKLIPEHFYMLDTSITETDTRVEVSLP